MYKNFNEFKVSDILNVEQTKSVIAKANLVEGNIPYVTRTVSDNGYMGTCGNVDKVNKGNCITIGAETGVAFYQPVDFVAGNKVYRLSADGLNEKHYLFLAGALNRLTKNYSYSNARIPEKIKKEIILLPIKVDENGNPIIDDTLFYHEEGFVPDFDYMQERIEELEQERIEELEQERIEELEQYLVATGLNDYELTDEDIEILSLSGFGHSEERDSEVAVKVCKEFKVSKNHNEVGLFDCFRGTRLTKANRIDGKIPLLTAGVGLGEGVAQNIQETNGLIKYSNDITIDMFGMCFYHDYEHYGDDNIHFLVNSTICAKAKLFITQLLQKQLAMQFSYGRQFRMNFLEKLYVSLPIQTDDCNNPIIDTECKYHPDGYIPDWDFMERYIRAIEKIVIADVVKYKDAMIAKAKEVVA